MVVGVVAGRVRGTRAGSHVMDSHRFTGPYQRSLVPTAGGDNTPQIMTSQGQKVIPPAAGLPSPRNIRGDQKDNGVSSALAQSGATWYYTWSTAHPGITTPQGTTFVPMIRAAVDATPANLAAAKAAGPYLLNFNEPDLSSQANMTVEQVLDLWPQLVAAGKILGSPSVASGADTSGGWLDRFMSGAKSRGYRVDFITLHSYGGDFRTTQAVSQLRSYLRSVYNRYHLPIWLTEYALVDFSHGTRFATPDQQAAFVTASATMLKSLSYVQRYAWFGLQSTGDAQSGLFRAGPQITTVAWPSKRPADTHLASSLLRLEAYGHRVGLPDRHGASVHTIDQVGTCRRDDLPIIRVSHRPRNGWSGSPVLGSCPVPSPWVCCCHTAIGVCYRCRAVR